MFKVIRPFLDLQDGEHAYEAGDFYPRLGFSPDEKRIAELSGSDNRIGKPLIVPDRSDKAIDDVPVETPTPKRKRAEKAVADDPAGDVDA